MLKVFRKGAREAFRNWLSRARFSNNSKLWNGSRLLHTSNVVHWQIQSLELQKIFSCKSACQSEWQSAHSLPKYLLDMSCGHWDGVWHVEPSSADIHFCIQCCFNKFPIGNWSCSTSLTTFHGEIVEKWSWMMICSHYEDISSNGPHHPWSL